MRRLTDLCCGLLYALCVCALALAAVFAAARVWGL